MSLTANVDLHSHSQCSDGQLTPSVLVETAAAAGVSMLALTDHDTVAGIPEARAQAQHSGVRLIPGVEISALWRGYEVHILGLNIDPEAEVLVHGLAQNQHARRRRLHSMAQKLTALNIPGAEAYLADLPADTQPGRGHLAQFLVGQGVVRNWADAFKRYLLPARRAYVAPKWVELDEAVRWINQAQGQAVLAHPLRYEMNWQRRLQLFDQFKKAGGQGLEVVSGRRKDMDGLYTLARHCRLFKLKASVGSDFHSAAYGGHLGGLPGLPTDLTPVWQHWPGVAEHAA